MKNKTSLMLMELLVMILVFALAGAICLKVFARSHEISEATLCRDRAVQVAQNAAETLKACRDLPEAARILGAQEQDGQWLLSAQDHSLTLLPLTSDSGGLAGCEVKAQWKTAEFTLQVFWQEVEP